MNALKSVARTQRVNLMILSGMVPLLYNVTKYLKRLSNNVPIVMYQHFAQYILLKICHVGH